MIGRLLFATGMLYCAATPGWTQGCPAVGGTEFPGIEELNQFLLVGDYDGFVRGVSNGSGGLISLDITPIARAFPGGLAYCTTIVQRFEPQGTMQSVVVFRAEAGPLFAYWLVLPTEDGYQLNTISLDTDLTAILNRLN